MIGRTLRRRIVALAWITTGASCATFESGGGLREPRGFGNGNPMRRIAVIGSSRVVLPTFGGEEVLGIDESRAAGDAVVEETRRQLEVRGYSIVHSSTVGLGFRSPGWIVESQRAEGAAAAVPVKRPIEPGTIALACPPAGWSQAANDAAARVCTSAEVAMKANLFDRFVPSRTDIQTLARETGADTVCVARAGGTLYTDARRSTLNSLTIVRSMLNWTTPGVAPTFQTESHAADDRLDCALVLVHAETGDVLWRGRGFSSDRNRSKATSMVGFTLAQVPDAGQTEKRATALQ